MNDYDEMGLAAFFDNALQDGSNPSVSTRPAGSAAAAAPPPAPAVVHPVAAAVPPPNQQQIDENNIEAIFDLAHPRNIARGPKQTADDVEDDFVEKGTTAIDYICDAFDAVGSGSQISVKDPGELVEPVNPATTTTNSVGSKLKAAAEPSVKTPEQQYNDDLDAYNKEKGRIDEHNNAMNWANLVVGGLRTLTGGFNTYRHARKAIKAKDRNRIAHRQSILSSISAGCSTLGGLMQGSSGIAGLAGDDGTASGVFSIIGGTAGVVGSAVDMSSSIYGAYKYKKIAELNKTNNRNYIAKNPANPQVNPPPMSAADRSRNNTIFKVHEMAGLNAKNQRKRNIASSVISGFGILGALGGLGASIAGVASPGNETTPKAEIIQNLRKKRLSSGILGIISSGVSFLGRAVSQITDSALDSSGKNDRKEYVVKYLNDKVGKIKAQAQTGKNQGGVNIPGVVIDDDAAKRIVLKKLGVYRGQILGQGPFTLDDETAKVMYNNIAMKRASKLAGLNAADAEKQKALDELGLNKMNATAEEIALAMGYQK